MRSLPTPAGIAERLRQSLFALPGLGVVVGAVLGTVVVRLDRAGGAGWLPEQARTTEESARSVLSSVATGTLTIVTLVLTLTLVAIQLAAGQLSPRTIANFLGDRFQQLTVGLVLGTATYSLLALRGLRVGEDERPPDLTVFTAIALVIASLLALMFSADRTARRLGVATLLDDLAEETTRLAHERYGDDGRVAPSTASRVVVPTDDSWPVLLAAPRSGWVQHVDESSLLDQLPDGAPVRLLQPVGTFVFAHQPLIALEADLEDPDDVLDAITIGEQRTMQQDVSYGLTRLSDIALRALSPGINDPNTAREVALRVGQIVLVLLAYRLDDPETEVDGHRMVRDHLPDHDALCHEAFDQIRRAAEHDVSTLVTLRRTIDTVLVEARRRELPGSTVELERQRRLVAGRLAELEPGGLGSEPPSLR